MPQTAAQTRAQLADTAKNPRRQVAGTGEIIHVMLRFENKNFLPEDLFDALEAKYGAGKVTSDLDTISQRQLQFVIRP